MDKYEKLYEVLSEQPDGNEKLQILEEWIAEAAEQNDYGWQYDTRMAQNEIAINVGRYDLLMDNFSWCLDVYEQNKDSIELEPLLWNFKWFLEYLDYFPRVSKEEIDDYFEYYKSLLMGNGYSLRSYFNLRTQHAMKSGYHRSVANFRDMWLKEEVDDLTDCELCEKSLMMRVNFELGELKEGFQLANELLKSGFTCGEVPHKVYPYLLLPAWNSERTEEAKRWQEQGYFLIRKNPKYMIEISHMMLFLSMVDIRKAYDIFLDHIHIADDSHDLHSRFYFYLAAWCMIEKAKETRYHMNEDASWFAVNVPALAEDFDLRNNTHHFKETIKDWMAYIKD